MKIISFVFRIDENIVNKSIKIFKPNLIKKLKRSILIIDNKIKDIRSDFTIPNKKSKILKIQLLLLNKIPNFLEVKEGCTLPIEYLKNNDYIFSKSAIARLPKISFKINKSNSKEDIRIFGKLFLIFNKRNKSNLLILYENKIFFQINEFFPKKYIDIERFDRFEIYLIAIKEIDSISFMFDGCTSLEEISVNENKNKFIENKELNNNHKIIFKDKHKEKTIAIINEEIKNFDILEDEYFPISLATLIFEKNKTDINEIIMLIYLMFLDNQRLFNIYKNKNNSLNKYSIFEDISSLILFFSDITHWNITSMAAAFRGCSLLNSIPDISTWNTEDANTMIYMFKDCKSLVSLPDISKWNTSKVTNITGMFCECNALVTLPDLSKWKFKNLKEISNIFENCSSLKSIPDISNWNTKNVKYFSSVFARCSSIISLPDISKWNTDNAEEIACMFFNCTSLVSLPDISKWNVNKVENMMGLFESCTSLLSLPDLSKWNIRKDTVIELIFFECSSLISLPDISKWNTENITSMENMFFECSSLVSFPDISKWNTKNVTNMESMFYDCSSLISLPDISKWNMKNVKNMNCMFYGCSALKSVPDISKWELNNIENVSSMFKKCHSLTSFPDLSNWNLYIKDRNTNISMYEDFYSLIGLSKLIQIYKPDKNKKEKEIIESKGDEQIKYIKTKEEITFDNNEKDINEYKYKIIELEMKLSKEKETNTFLSIKLKDEIKLGEIQDDIISDFIINKTKDELEIKDLKYQVKEFVPNYNIINPLINEENENEKEKNEKPFHINFVSSNNDAYYTFPCKKTDLVCTLEEKLSEEFEEYKKNNFMLIMDTRRIKRFKTVEENGIKNGDVIHFFECY